MNPARDKIDTSKECPFCAIARGADPAAEIVCEGRAWIAFFPLEPATPGHTLVIPRIHVADLWDADERTAQELTSAILVVGNAIDRALHPAGMNLISSAGEVAEQSIFHLHLHLVPRSIDDRLGQIWPDQGDVDPATTKRLAERIRGECSFET